MSERTEEDFVWKETYDCASNPSGVQMYALTIRLSTDLGVPTDQIMIRTKGKIDRESKTIKVGSCRIFLEFVPTPSQIDAISLAVATVTPKAFAEYGIMVEDYSQWLRGHMVGEQVYVNDQQRNGGDAQGCWVWKATNRVIRRIHDNEIVYTKP